MKPKVITVSPEKMGRWPSVILVSLAECADLDDYGTWEFRFEATYGKGASQKLAGKKMFKQWAIRGCGRHQGEQAKEKFLKRAEAEGIRFVYLFETHAPPTAEMVHFIKNYNAKLLAEREEAAEAA